MQMTTTRKIQVLIAVVITSAIAIFLLRQIRSKNHDLPQILESGRLYVLTDSSSLGFCQQDGKVGGFQYEIVKAFADTLGVELVITEENDLKKCVELLKDGDYNLVANMMPVTSEWKKDLIFSQPIQWSRLMLVQADYADSLPMTRKNVLELASDTIGVPINSPHKLRISHLSDEIAQPIVVKEFKSKSAEQLVQMVSKHKIKYTVCDENSGKRYMQKYPNINVSLPLGFSQPMAWAVHSKSKLLNDELNAFLDDFIGSTAYWEIYRKYY
jgi:membrane-bound lytic murein transglycosylase F